MNAPATQSRATPSDKLLTREDLVQLEVPPADVLQWLLAGSLCEAGSLPGDGASVAVFAVPDPELRSELAERLASIGKTDVALTRPQARAEVVRAVMAQRGLTPVETPLVEVGEIEAGLEAAVDGEAEIGVEVEVEVEVEADVEAEVDAEADVDAASTSASATDSEDAEFFDADALVQELDAWSEPETGQIEHGEIEEEPETMSATPDPLDAADAVAEAAEELPMDEITPDGPIDEDGSTTLLDDLTGAAAEFEAGNDDATDTEAADDAPDTGTIDAVAGAAIDDLVEPAVETRNRPSLDLPGFDEPLTDEPTSGEADADIAAVLEGESAADPEAANDTAKDDAAAAEDEAAAAAADDTGSVPETAGDEPPGNDDTLLEEPVNEEPVNEESVKGWANADDPFSEPSAEESVTAAPLTEAALFEEPIAEAPAEAAPPEESLIEQPPAEEPAAAGEEPAAAEPLAEEQPPEEPPFEDSTIEESSATEPVIEDAPAAASAAVATTDEAMTRVESFLGELRGALVDLAQRPPEAAPPVDMQPLVAAVGEFGQRVEHGVAVGVHAAMLNGGKRAEAPATVQYVKVASSGQEITMLSVAFLILCWSGILWFKTGNAVLAIGTLVGANVIGCCLLARRR